jgi:hypothetical protein
VAATVTAFWLPLIAGFLYGVLVVLLTQRHGRTLRRKRRSILLGRDDKSLAEEYAEKIDAVKTGSAWNFKDSFATNVTAIGGLLAAALTAAGSSSSLLPGVETNRFSLLNAAWAGLAAIAPIVIGLGTRTPEDHVAATAALSPASAAL